MKRLFYRKFTFTGKSKQGVKVHYRFTLRNDDVKLSPSRFFQLFDLGALNVREDINEEILMLVSEAENKLTQKPLLFVSGVKKSKGYTFKYICRPNVNWFARLYSFVISRMR